MGTDTLVTEIPIPSDLGHERRRDLSRWAREAAVAAMFEAGEIGSGEGAALLGITRYAFYDVLRAHRVSPVDATLTGDDIQAEAATIAECQAVPNPI